MDLLNIKWQEDLPAVSVYVSVRQKMKAQLDNHVIVFNWVVLFACVSTVFDWVLIIKKKYFSWPPLYSSGQSSCL
jgi:hypothetical protein